MMDRRVASVFCGLGPRGVRLRGPSVKAGVSPAELDRVCRVRAGATAAVCLDGEGMLGNAGNGRFLPFVDMREDWQADECERHDGIAAKKGV